MFQKAGQFCKVKKFLFSSGQPNLISTSTEGLDAPNQRNVTVPGNVKLVSVMFIIIHPLEIISRRI